MIVLSPTGFPTVIENDTRIIVVCSAYRGSREINRETSIKLYVQYSLELENCNLEIFFKKRRSLETGVSKEGKRTPIGSEFDIESWEQS